MTIQLIDEIFTHNSFLCQISQESWGFCDRMFLTKHLTVKNNEVAILDKMETLSHTDKGKIKNVEWRVS